METAKIKSGSGEKIVTFTVDDKGKYTLTDATTEDLSMARWKPEGRLA